MFVQLRFCVKAQLTKDPWPLRNTTPPSPGEEPKEGEEREEPVEVLLACLEAEESQEAQEAEKTQTARVLHCVILLDRSITLILVNLTVD